MLKIESSKTFMDQLREGIGELDDERWNRVYVPILGINVDVPRVTLKAGTPFHKHFFKTQIFQKARSWFLQLNELSFESLGV